VRLAEHAAAALEVLVRPHGPAQIGGSLRRRPCAMARNERLVAGEFCARYVARIVTPLGLG
jgi:hypothetical protein